MSAPPFPNEYNSRRVAESDARPCSVCFKPTSTVLLASNKVDHFYVCAMHMKDRSFASPIIPESYTKLVSDGKRLEDEVRHANGLADANRPYSWTKLMSNIGWSDPVQRRPKDSQDSKDKSEDNNSKSASERKKEETYEELVSQANQLKKQLAEVNSAIAEFQFKQFELAKDVYKMRVNNSLQARNRMRKPEAASKDTGVIFPAVPKSSIN